MAYLNLDLDYFDHPKTLRMIGLLGEVGAEIPIRLWAKVGKFFPRDGFLRGYSEADIDAIVGWHGKSGSAAAAMITVGFLIKEKGGFRIHDWEEHEGHIWALKIRNCKIAKKRWSKLRTAKKRQAAAVEE